MAEIILFQDAKFGGLHTHQFQSVSDLKTVGMARLSVAGSGHTVGDWNDTVSSFVVISGVWKFFYNSNFGDPAANGREFGPGLYPGVTEAGINNDKVSSIQLVRE